MSQVELDDAGHSPLDTVRRFAGRLSIQYNVGRRWSRPVAQPRSPSPLAGVKVNAIIPTWCEEDVIASTVANAFAQGCDRVFLVDNESPDATVAEAVGAGAEIARVYHTDFWDDSRKMAEICDLIQEVSAGSGEDHVWWMVCDADEFPHGPGGLTVAQYLSGLDARFRVVGARVFNHFPSEHPQFLAGHHPLDYQPLCQEVRMAWCSLSHWKHPLMRWDRGSAPITPRVGCHRVDAPDRVLEPKQGIYLHHFPFRDQEVTFGRLQRLCGSDDGQAARTALESSRQFNRLDAVRRHATLEAVYAGRWDEVTHPAPGGQITGVNPRPWTVQVDPADQVFARWYPASDVAARPSPVV